MTTVDRKDLLEVLTHAKRVVGSGHPLPILQNVSLEAREDRLTVSAWDLEVGFQTYVPAKEVAPWATTAGARELYGALRSLKGPSVTLQGGAGTEPLRVSAGAVTLTLGTLPQEEYPSLPEVTGKAVSVNTATLGGQLARAQPFLSVDETRVVFTGMLFRVEHGRGLLVGTDSYRLAYARLGKVRGAQDCEGILPGRFTKMLTQALKQEPSGMVAVTVNGKRLQTTFRLPSGAVWYSRMIEGQYPNYARLLNGQSLVGVDFARADLLEALAAVRLPGNRGPCTVRFSPNGDTVRLDAHNEEGRTAEATVAGRHDVPNWPPFGLNPDYMKDALESVGGTTVSLTNPVPAPYGSKFSPVLVLTPEDKTFGAVVMPCQLQ